MPAAAPWLDQAAPAQFSVFRGFGEANHPATGGQDSGAFSGSIGLGAASGGGGELMGAQANNTAVDTTLHWKVSGTIVLALIVIFGLQAMGFRFVTSANVSLGVGGR